ncbi:MAG: thiol oxidoreductase [Candidatus Dadabacteria bacterium]|nr:MAG: thiol oxidoreductase [Candidatus Dadabacteria bacterium]
MILISNKYSIYGFRALKRLLFTLYAALLLFPAVVFSQDITNLGGDLSTDRPGRFSVQLPAPNIRSDEFFDYHLTGFVEFHRSFALVKLNGKKVLGPRFNHNSCGGCHTQNGKGKIGFFPRAETSSMIVRVSLPGTEADGSPKQVPGAGGQLQDHTIKGKKRYKIRLSWKKRIFKYPDGKRVRLRKPRLTFRIPGLTRRQRRRIRYSLRMAPPMVGMGLIEAVSEDTLKSLADPEDQNGDGISGRINYVMNKETGTLAVGRFGFKAGQPSVKQQTAAAFFNDMGMTSSLFQDPRQQQEVSDDTLNRITFYLQAAGVPIARNQDDPEVKAGKILFQQIGCNKCHIITLTTGNSSVVEVANQTFHPFSDLLLHDMGRGLADKHPEFSAKGSEWRTTPLWGLGMTGVFNKNKPGYLHDGRARTLEEAIIWHSGEAKTSRDNFAKLTKDERSQLIKFLRSL